MTARRHTVLGLLACLLALSLVAATANAASKTRASFTQVESDVMCVACHEPLALAQSPEAYSERQYIRQLIAQGLTQSQIEKQLVAQYGPAVLGKPPASGFNLLIYILPPAVLLIGLATILYTLPRWRRRAKQAAAAPIASSDPLDPADARRLDEELARGG